MAAVTARRVLGCSALAWSCKTQWRWEKVPRSTSCPEMRTWFPSTRSDAHASCSPSAQSMPLPDSIMAARACVQDEGEGWWGVDMIGGVGWI
eukprot:scaffold24272_cov27-Tisochrysis_lutea.AAC.5